MDVFLTSPWIPAEWISAHGLQPRAISSAQNFHPGRWPLAAGECAFAGAAVRFAEARPDCAVIFSTSCDQLRRGFDSALLAGQSHAFLFNLPATWQTEAASRMFRAELVRLGDFVLTIGGHRPSGDELLQEMERRRETRLRLLESVSATSAREFAEAAAQFHWGSHGRDTLPPVRLSHARQAEDESIPLALIGGPFLSQHWKWLDELEAVGGRIALNATEWGERSLGPASDEPMQGGPGARASSPAAFGVSPKAFETGKPSIKAAASAFSDSLAPPSGERGTPLADLAGTYCENIVDVFQRPNTRLYAWLKPRLASRQVRGIILWHFTGCDLWRAEAQTLRDRFDLPVLLLEAGAEPGVAPRDLNRLQAFVEMLK